MFKRRNSDTKVQWSKRLLVKWFDKFLDKKYLSYPYIQNNSILMVPQIQNYVYRPAHLCYDKFSRRLIQIFELVNLHHVHGGTTTLTYHYQVLVAVCYRRLKESIRQLKQQLFQSDL